MNKRNGVVWYLIALLSIISVSVSSSFTESYLQGLFLIIGMTLAVSLEILRRRWTPKK